MDNMTCKQVREMLLACAYGIQRNIPLLTRVDSAIGDGDHGIGMGNGMRAAAEYLEGAAEEKNVFSLFSKMASSMERSMGGASGVIFSTLFACDAECRSPSEALTPGDLSSMLRAGLTTIQAIGHAGIGDKTMVDALAPAVEAMEADTSSFESMLTAGECAAAQGVEKTKSYIAKFGRAKSLGQRALGHPDAGAVSVWLILRQMRDYVLGQISEDPKMEENMSGAMDEPAGNKKIINRPRDVVREEAEGFLAAYGRDIQAIPGVNGLIKRNIPQGKTALVIGGGSGHEPMFGFFLGENLADAAANGNVFASPDPTTIVKTAMLADRGAGVLFVYGNYAGDNLNFDKAVAALADRGISSKTVRVWDDVASAPRERIEERRGIAGDVFVLKIAGAACAKLPLEEAYRVTSKARDNVFSIGVGLQGATIPGQAKPIFTLPKDEIEYGLGIHGEPGIHRLPMQTADEIVSTLTSALLEEGNIRPGDTVCSYVNGLGSTTLMELMIMNRKLAQILSENDIHVHDMEVNSLVTTMEMAGASISLMKLDEELLLYYNMPCSSPYYKKGNFCISRKEQ